MRYDAKTFTGVDPSAWKPSVFSPSMLEEIHSDAALWASKDSIYDTVGVAAYNEATAWASTQRVATFLQGTGAQGLPQAMYQDVVASMAPLVLQTPRSAEELQKALEQAMVGIVANGLSAIPIVGGIAAGIWNLGYWLVNLKRRPAPEIAEFFRPMTQYSVDAAEIAMKGAFPVFTQSDWTSFFLPRLGDELRIEGRDGGLCPAWALVSDERLSNSGFVPGAEFVAGPIQAFAVPQPTGAKPCHTSDPKLGECEVPEYGCTWSTRGGNEVDWRDIGSFYPELARMLFAVSGTVQQPGTPLWSVDTDAILKAWEEHLSEVLNWADDTWDARLLPSTGLNGVTANQRQSVIQALVRPYFVADLGQGKYMRGFGAVWTPGSKNGSTIVDHFVRPWCEAVKRRQHYYLGTTYVAYADSAGGAFADPQLRQRLEEMRRLLLQSPYRRQVILADVLDADYRQALFDSTVGQTLTSVPPTGDGPSPIHPDSEGPPPPADEPKGGAPFGREVAQLQPLESRSDPGKVIAIGLGSVAAVMMLRNLWKLARSRSAARPRSKSSPRSR